MASDIEVAHQGVKVAIADLDALAEALTGADTFVDTYFRVQPGGRFLTQASDLLDSIRAKLGDQYRGLSTKVDDASDSILVIWKEFERTDGQARVEFERQRERARRVGSGDLPPLTEPPEVAPHPPPRAATRSVDAATLAAILASPKADTRVLEMLDCWREIGNKIDLVLSFEFLVIPLGKVGLHVPLNQFAEWMEGNYLDMAEAAAGVFVLSTFFESVGDDVGLTSGQVGGHWLGETSEAVQSWLGTLAGAASLHSRGLAGFAGGIQMQAQTLKLVLDQILDLLGDLADCVPVLERSADNLMKTIESLAEAEMKRFWATVFAAFRIVTKLILRLTLMYDAVIGLITILSSYNDVEFPAVPAPTAPR